MYAMTCTRPDVSFSFSMVSRHQHNPGEFHWTVVNNILKYLRNTKDRLLVYGGEEELKVTVTWKRIRQYIVADSTCESQYIAACEASKEAIWMRNFIGDLGVVPTVQDPIEIFCDNESQSRRRTHDLKQIRSEDNPADPFTNALAKSRNDEHAMSIALKDKIKF
ncbi:hypothetical protein Tco_0971899 [Tanacetum coccineum]